MADDASSAEASSRESPAEEDSRSAQEVPSEPPKNEAITAPEGFTEIEPTAGPLDVEAVRSDGATLVLLKLPPNFDVKALHGKSIRMKKTTDAAGAVGTVELDNGIFSLLATATEEYTRYVNAFPAGTNGYRLGVPFAAGLTLVSSPDLPPVPAAEAASDGGGARDKPRAHPPLKLRWRPPGATVAPNTPVLPEAIRLKQQKRRSVTFDASTKHSKGKRANEASPADTVAKPSTKEASTPDAADAKHKKHKSSPSAASPAPASSTPKEPKKEKTKSPAPAMEEAIVSPPPSKKSRSKEKD